MHRLTISIGQIIVLILALASANTQLYALGAKPKESKIEQSQSASGTATCYTFLDHLRPSDVQMPTKGDQIEMAYKLFELNPNRFHIESPRQELVLKGISSGEVSMTVRFKQVYNGVDLLDSDIGVHFTIIGGRLYTVSGTYCGDITLSTIPQIDSTEAQKISLKQWAHPGTKEALSSNRPPIHLAIWRSEHDKLYLIWMVRLIWQFLPDHIWEYYINAHDGTVLRKAEYSSNN